MTTGAMNSSYHGIAARLDRLPISGFHKKILWLLAGITFCDSVDMAVGGPYRYGFCSLKGGCPLSSLRSLILLP